MTATATPTRKTAPDRAPAIVMPTRRPMTSPAKVERHFCSEVEWVGRARSADAARPLYQSIRFDAEGHRLLATDGHRLHLVPGIRIDKSQDGLYGPDGRRVEGAFPNCDHIIPADEAVVAIYTLTDTAEFVARCQAMIAYGRFHNGMGLVSIGIGERRTHVNAHYLLDALPGMMAEFTISVVSPLSPIRVNTLGGTWIAMVMPVRSGGGPAVLSITDGVFAYKTGPAGRPEVPAAETPTADPAPVRPLSEGTKRRGTGPRPVRTPKADPDPRPRVRLVASRPPATWVGKCSTASARTMTPADLQAFVTALLAARTREEARELVHSQFAVTWV